MKQQVFFRVEGNTVIGFGHYTRSIALAQLLGHAFECRFFSREIPSHLKTVLEKEGYVYTIVENENEFIQQCTSEIIVVVDDYSKDESFRQTVVATGARLVVIDDTSGGNYTAHALINHAPGIQESAYHLLQGGKTALGPAYALVRREFQAIAREQQKTGNHNHIFVCFGGADPKGLTLPTIQEILKTLPDATIEVVVSPAIHNTLTALSDRIHVHADLATEQMIAIMRQCGRAIVPASGLLSEALAVGLEVISGYYINNQRQMYEGYKALDVFADAGTFEPGVVSEVLQQPVTHRQHPIDGFAPYRFRNLFHSLINANDFRLRYALPEDTETTYRWANDPVIRAHSFTKTFTPFEAHAAWFGKKLRDPSCLYYLVEVDGKIAGSVRFDLTGDEAVISYLLDPAFHGKKLGERSLAEGMRLLVKEPVMQEKNIRKITGKVQSQNIPSVKTFENLTFECSVEGEGILLFTRNLPL